MDTTTTADLERTRSAYEPATAPRPDGKHPAAFLASAVFAAGVASFVVLQRPAPQTAPEALLPPAPEARTQADAGVLVPFAPAPLSTPQYEDGLVPFSLLAPIVNEGPLLEAKIATPLMPREAALRMPILQLDTAPTAQPEQPFLEHGRVRARLTPMTLLGGAQRLPDLSGREGLDARAARGAVLWAATRAAAAAVFGIAPTAQAASVEDPAHALYRGVVELNGGYQYTETDTHDFSQGYKVCSREGFSCRPQKDGMVIKTPEGATIAHSYLRERNPRNAIFVLLPGAAAAQDISHCPLVFDLAGRGVRTSDQPIKFDVDGRGRLADVHDIASDTGVLAFDADGNGIAGATGRELFGDGTDLDGDGLPDGHLDGFDALDSFVRRAEKAGVILAGTADSGILTASDLAKLHKRYGLSLRIGSLGGRAVSPAQAGVARINLSAARSIRSENFDAQQNDVVRRRGATFVRADGSTGDYEDIFFRYDRPNLKLAVASAK